MNKKLLLALMTLFALASGCRSMDANREESELAAVPDRPWFDAYGDAVTCDAPPKAGCPVGSFDPKYIDACVEKGFQGRSCGCVAACSGKVVTKEKAPPQPPPGTPAKDVCNETDRKAYEEIYAGRNSDSSKCIDAHVCKGDVGPCTERSKPVSLKLRQLARGACGNEIFGKFCGGASVKGALECSDANIEQISEVYQEAFSGSDPKLRRCLRERLCSIVTGDCKDAIAAKADKTAASIRSPGCDYWVASFCSLK